jgi:hypothetical protein
MSFKTQQPRIQISANDLSSRVDSMKTLVKKSFFPSLDVSSLQEEFNFEVYTRFKVYNDLLIEQKVSFVPFYHEFEHEIGTRLLELMPLQQQQQQSLLQSPSESRINNQVQHAFWAAEMIVTSLVENGFITSWERSVASQDDILDFTEPYVAPSSDNFSVTSDLQFTLALVGDITLKSQLLLQELGYRLYPAFGRWGLQQSLVTSFPLDGDGKKSVVVNVDDYYMDTAYNSNPDLFEVKQILLNVVLQRM